MNMKSGSLITKNHLRKVKIIVFTCLNLFVVFFVHGQSNNILAGVWHTTDRVYEEYSGWNVLEDTIEIVGGNYSWERAWVSESAPYGEYSTRGKIVIMENEIYLFPKNEKTSRYDWSDIEETELKIEKYNFILNGQYLILMAENYNKIFKKIK